MRIRRLGRTGLKVSNLCLGAMTFGNPYDFHVRVRAMMGERRLDR